MERYLLFLISIAIASAGGILAWLGSGLVLGTGIALAALFGLLALVGIYDLSQSRHTLWRNFPILGRGRWVMEEIRPFFRAYFVESETEGRPFDHETRTLVYRRAKDVTSVEPFGSHVDNDRTGYEWLAPSVAAKTPSPDSFRVTVGGADCRLPYSASVLNISAMSFGSLGARAIEALNRGAAKGVFFHDTGEGGVSRYHKAGGGDLVWEIGSGYFGCRSKDGGFDAGRFQETAADDQVKMIEVKLSQGAKPGHGGVLPGEKVTPEIAEARGIQIGETCYSPAAHSAFSTPVELLEFIASLRDLSGGKPVGFKLCAGPPHEAFALVKAMLKTGIKPDFIVIDGAEGGTGAAPAEFLDHIGAPLRNGLILFRNALLGTGLKDEVRLAASGKQVTAFQMASSLAMGADWINSARGFMFALGCIQSLSCHTNRCPTGITTQDRSLQRGLVVSDKAERVYQFHRNTVHALAEVVGAAGCTHPSELGPQHIRHRIDLTHAESANSAYALLSPGELLDDADATRYARDWNRASPDTFAPRPH